MNDYNRERKVIVRVKLFEKDGRYARVILPVLNLIYILNTLSIHTELCVVCHLTAKS